MLKKKQWYLSKTLWTSISAFLVVLCGELFASPSVALGLEKALAIILPVIMMVLRLVTKLPIGYPEE